MQKFKTNVPIQHIHLDLMAYAVTNGSQGFDTIKMSSKSYLSSMLGKSGEKKLAFFFHHTGPPLYFTHTCLGQVLIQMQWVFTSRFKLLTCIFAVVNFCII